MSIPKIKCVGYVRLSQEDKSISKDEMESSILNQRRDIEEFCQKTNRDLIRTFQDLYLSGSDRFRPALTEMMLWQNNFKEIIIKDSSRLARDESFFRETLKELDQNGIKVFSLMDNRYLSYKNIGDRFIAMSHEYYVLKGQEDYERLLLRKQEDGGVLGSPVYGFKWKWQRGKVPKGETNHWIFDSEDKVAIASGIFNLKKSGKSAKEIAEFYHILIRQVYKILSNEEVYKGFIVLKRRRKDKFGKWEVFDTIRYKGNYIPLLNQETNVVCVDNSNQLQ